ncbi:SDR family NAD(P)-dependent oxidoreductase [Nocardioides zeae]|uniref:SDR family oxidoreductase n=1 Tax=Nocardioides zeae TaxID=1457234 RepID=A0A6P0HM09_9ACTN|nr:SDR family oxidoreductase [Nocardioides zeae]NEN79708.1 SDR family oxidoreductase [Nocardioides zeae]
MSGVLANRRAIVTGGAGGMGRAHALRLASLGADVAIIDIDLDVAQRWQEELTAPTVADEIRALGVRSIAIQADITDAAAADAAVAQVVREWSGLDILVNNAGGAVTPYDRSTATTTTDEDVRRVVDLNLIGTVNMCRAAAPHLTRPGGSVVNIATIGVDVEAGTGQLALYAAAKAAVVRYTRSLAVELGPEGIRANALSPGLIQTARIRALAASRPGAGGGDPAAGIPLRRVGDPDDVSKAVAFLAGDDAAYVTGENLRVGGGIHLV